MMLALDKEDPCWLRNFHQVSLFCYFPSFKKGSKSKTPPPPPPPLPWGQEPYQLSDTLETVVVVLARRAQPKNVWVNACAPPGGGIGAVTGTPAAGHTALPAPTVLVIDSLCICRESGLSSPFSSLNPRNVWKAGRSSQKGAAADCASGTPTPAPSPALPAPPQPQPQLRLRCSVLGLCGCRADSGGGICCCFKQWVEGRLPRRLFISVEEFWWQLGQVAAGQTQVCWWWSGAHVHRHAHILAPADTYVLPCIHVHTLTGPCAPSAHACPRRSCRNMSTHTHVDTRSLHRSFIKQEHTNIKLFIEAVNLAETSTIHANPKSHTFLYSF